jgi:hypothetical protein
VAQGGEYVSDDPGRMLAVTLEDDRPLLADAQPGTASVVLDCVAHALRQRLPADRSSTTRDRRCTLAVLCILTPRSPMPLQLSSRRRMTFISRPS